MRNFVIMRMRTTRTVNMLIPLFTVVYCTGRAGPMCMFVKIFAVENTHLDKIEN